MKPKVGSFEEINNIDKPLVRMSKIIIKTQLGKLRNKRGDITTDTHWVQIMITTVKRILQ